MTPPEEMFEIPKGYSVIDEAYIGHETREMFKTGCPSFPFHIHTDIVTHTNMRMVGSKITK